VATSLSLLDDGFAYNLFGDQPNPRPYYAELHRLAPVYRTPADFWYVSTYALAREVYGNQESWSVEPPDRSKAERSWALRLWYRSLMTLDDPEHKRVQRFVFTLRTRQFIERLQSTVHEVMDDQWRHIGDRAFDFKEDFAAPVGMKIIMRILGLDDKDTDAFVAMSQTMRRVLDPTVSDEELADADRIWSIAADAVRETAESRRSHPRDDVISTLVSHQDSSDLTEEEVLAIVFQLLVAGNETSSNSMVNGLYHLLANPELFQKVRNDRSLLPSAIEELLRYDSAARNGVARYATQDFMLGGERIRQGERVYVGNHPANHDASVFEDPHELDLSRSPNRHIAFGFGVHHCLGSAVARLEMTHGYESIMDRYTEIELVEPEAQWEAGFIRRALERLPVRGVLAEPGPVTG